MDSSTSLSQRLGRLYCFYCLYETQPYKPRVKIYLCLGELKRLKLLVVDAKENGIRVVPAIVKRMLTENMLLFGSSDSGSINQRVDAVTKLQDSKLQIAYEKLRSNTEIEDYVHMNCGPKPGKPTDLSRMRHLLVKLKHNTPPHMETSLVPASAPADAAEAKLKAPKEVVVVG